MDLSAFPYLQGNYAPIDEERDFDESQLRVEGEVPRQLLGAYMRDGANVAFQPNHYVYPLDGDGMVHAVYFQDGLPRRTHQIVLRGNARLDAGARVRWKFAAAEAWPPPH